MRPLIRKFFGVVTVLTALSCVQTAQAQLQCAALFSLPNVTAAPNNGTSTTAKTSAAEEPTSQAQSPTQATKLRSLLNYLRSRGSTPLNRDLFLARLGSYREALQKDPNAKLVPEDSAEDRLALLSAAGEKFGVLGESVVSQYQISNLKWVPVTTRKLSGLDFTKGIRANQVEKIFTQLYLASHTDPTSWSELKRTTLPDTATAMIRQWSELEIGRRGMVQVLADMGLVRSSDQVEKINRIIFENPAAVETIVRTAVNSFNFALMSWYPYLPNGKRLFHKKLTADFRNRLVKEGFEPLRQELEAYYGWRPEVIIAWKYTTRVINACVWGFFLYKFTPVLLHATLPPDYTESNSVLTLMGDIAHYWTHVVQSTLDPHALQPAANSQAAKDAAEIASFVQSYDPGTNN